MAGSQSLAVRRQRESRHEEYRTQRQVVALLAKHLGPQAFFTSIENRPRSAIAAMHQQARGVRAGLPDIAVVIRGPSEGLVKLIFLELKSRRGQASPRQREVAAELQASGAGWHLARSARAALFALHMAGVPLGRWRPPTRLQSWEGPFADPNQRLPMHPAILREQRAARRRWRARQRAAARLEAQSAAAISGPRLVSSDARPA